MPSGVDESLEKCGVCISDRLLEGELEHFFFQRRLVVHDWLQCQPVPTANFCAMSLSAVFLLRIWKKKICGRAA